MAQLNIIPCPGCSQRVDDRAPACPSCGESIYIEHPADMLRVRHRPLAYAATNHSWFSSLVALAASGRTSG